MSRRNIPPAALISGKSGLVLCLVDVHLEKHERSQVNLNLFLKVSCNIFGSIEKLPDSFRKT